MTSYWNGSAWVELVNPTADAHTSHSTAAGKSATVGFSVRDEIGLPRMMTARLQNASDNPFGNSGGEAKGHLTGTLTAFMPIKVVDSDNNDILFHGLVKDTIESYANDFGQVLDVIGEDYLMELRDTSTKNGLGYNIKLSGINLYDAVEKSDATDANIGRAGTEYTTFVSSRGGLIKSLITQFSNNLVHPGDADSSDDRFVESVAQFPTDTKYNLGGSGAKSVLAHILGLAIVDPHTTTRAVGEADFGYDYYASPGFTSTATSDDAKAYFNYFKRGTRPLGDPATYGLRVEYPSPGVTANGKFSQTGQLLAMTDFSFERPKDELFTEANVDFKQEVSKNEGDAVVSSKSAKMELWTVHTTTDVDDFVYKGKYIKGHPTGTNGVAGDNSESLKLTMTALNGALGSGGGDTSMPVDSVAGLYVGQLLTIGTSTEIISISAINSGTSTLTVVRENFPGSPQSHSDNAVVYARNVATIQWVTSDANADSDGTIYVLVSDIDPRLENDTTNIWVTGGSSKVWVGEVSGSSFKLKGRPYITHGVRRSTTFSTGSDSDPDSIRQSVLAKLKRGSYQIVRGDFKTYEAPRFYFDNSPTSVVSTAVTLSGSVNPKNYGFMVGMTVVKLDSNGNPTSTYGYASAVTTTVVTVTMSASISASDTLRYYVPVRAGNLIEVRNDLVNVSGKFLVTKSVYDTSSGGQAFTTFEVIGAEDIEGTGQARGDILSSLSNAAGTNEGLPANLPFSSSIANSSTDLEFESTDADEVIWHGAASDSASGTLIIDGETYTIGASNTGTMNSDGRDYWIYYTKGEAGLTTIEKSSWTTVANENTLLVGIAEYYSPEARFTIFVREFNTKHTKFAAADKIVKHTLTSVLAKKGMLGWTTNTVFSATGTADEYNKIKFGLKGTIANNSAVQFSDGETAEVVLSSTNVTWGNGNSSSMSGGKITLAAGVNYFYKTVGSTTLQVSATYSDAIADDKILMAMVLVASSDDGSSSPSIFPFNGSEATISTGVLSAGAIVAGNIQAGIITTKITSDMSGVTMDTAGKIYSGSKAYEDNNAGFVIDGGTTNGRFQIGPNNGNNLKWTGSALSIKGTITLSDGTAEAAITNANTTKANVGLTDVQDLDAQGQAQTGLIASTTITGGGITLNGGGDIKSTGKSYASSGAGFFLGYSNSNYQFDIGSSANYLRWSGSALSIKGTITLSDGTAEAAIKNSNTVGSDLGTGYGDSDIGGWTLAASSLTSTDGLLELYDTGTIKGWKTEQTDANLKYILATGTAALTVYGSTQADPAIKIQTAYGSSTFGYIYGDTVGSTSDVSYSARWHRFHNFGGPGYINRLSVLGFDNIANKAFVDLSTPDSLGVAQNISDLYVRANGAAMYMYLGGGGADDRLKVANGTTYANNDFDPKTDGTHSFGNTSYRWLKAWYTEDADVTSDAALKENMNTITDGLDVITSLNPIKYNRIGSTTTEFGFTSQAVKDVMVAKGYGTDVGVYSERYDEHTGGTAWGLSSNQLIAHLVASIKELKERIIVLEGG